MRSPEPEKQGKGSEGAASVGRTNSLQVERPFCQGKSALDLRAEEVISPQKFEILSLS